MNFDQSPLLVIWETTQACDLACVHCRASAAPLRHRSELTTDEGFRLLEQIREFGSPLMVFTGGDPLRRPDLFPLLRHSVALGLRTNVNPSATPLLTREAIREFKNCGVARMAVSLDGPNAASHDGFRGVPGTYDRAVEALEDARLIGLETQLQTTVTRRNMNMLDEIAQIAAAVNVRMWSVFFLVVTGRALADDDLIAEEYEQVFQKLYEISQWANFEIKTTEAMHYRRFLAMRRQETAEHGDAQRTVWRTAGVSDGRGFIFISHTGEICPSGFFCPFRRETSARTRWWRCIGASACFEFCVTPRPVEASAGPVSIRGSAAVRGRVRMQRPVTTSPRIRVVFINRSGWRNGVCQWKGGLCELVAFAGCSRCIVRHHHCGHWCA
jgi:MoaA/NifB/PqqE/SkfB family radical SAM enzyme